MKENINYADEKNRVVKMNSANNQKKFNRNASKSYREDNIEKAKLDQVKCRRDIFNCGLGSNNLFRPKTAHKKKKNTHKI